MKGNINNSQKYQHRQMARKAGHYRSGKDRWREKEAVDMASNVSPEKTASMEWLKRVSQNVFMKLHSYVDNLVHGIRSLTDRGYRRRLAELNADNWKPVVSLPNPGAAGSLRYDQVLGRSKRKRKGWKHS